MKVLMQIRSNAFELSGGDTIQMLKTKEALEKLGIEVDISLSLRPDVSGYDVIHLFNLTRVQETYVQLKNAKAAHKPVVLSTIYWPILKKMRRGVLEAFLAVISVLIRWSVLKRLENIFSVGRRMKALVI